MLISVCPVGELQPTLEDKMSCFLENNCSSVKCCLEAPLIERTLSVGLRIETCNRKLHLNVEKFTHEVELNEETYGQRHMISLSGILTLRYYFCE